MIITEPKALKQALTSIKRVTLKRDKRNQNNTLTKINVRSERDILTVIACNGHVITRRVFKTGDDPEHAHVDFNVLIDPAVIPSNIPTDRITISEDMKMLTFYKADAGGLRYIPLSLPVTPCDDNGNKYINDAEIINAPYPGERAIHFNKASLLNAINAATSNDIIVLNMPESPLAPMYINGLSEYGDTMILPLRK